MHGGKHRDPSVFTHFVPGMLTGFVVGGIVGTVMIYHIAAQSMQYFWHAARADVIANAEEVCTNSSGLQITSRVTDAGSLVTSVVIGDGEEYLLTLPVERIHFVPSSRASEAYLTSVSTLEQLSAFPATSLYRIDYCAKTLTHLLGDHQESVEILGMSHGGSWALYMKNSALMLMQVDEARVFSFSRSEIGRPEEVLFSPYQDAVALRFGGGVRVVWNVGLRGQELTEEVGSFGDTLPAWGLRTVAEYVANIK